MRVIARKTLRAYAEQYPDATGQLDTWYHEARRADWVTPADVKSVHGSASILRNNRVVFNIKGNQYRLVVWINYAYRIVYVRWFGSHREYDNVDATTI
jgi:mRNA interferase HigB